MDIESVVAQLREELARIEQAIAALVGLESGRGARRGRPPKSSAGTSQAGKRRTMSAAARAKISAAQKARWARQKGKSAPAKSAGRRPMSAAMRKRLSAMMKARWAARKKSE